MARDEAPPFVRGGTWYGGNTINQADPQGLGGINLEGKEWVFEPSSEIDPSTYPSTTDPNGRFIRVKCVRNRSTINIKPGRLVHYDAGGTFTFNSATVGPFNGDTGVDGYCYQLADRPAGVADELLPAAGVPPWDLFYIVVDGPTKFVNQHASPITTAIGSKLVPAATGSNRTDDLAGRVALQDLTGATATLANNIQNAVGYADAVNSTADASFKGIVRGLG